MKAVRYVLCDKVDFLCLLCSVLALFSVKKILVEIWYKICDFLFLLFNYNIYICSQIERN